MNLTTTIIWHINNPRFKALPAHVLADRYSFRHSQFPHSAFSPIIANPKSKIANPYIPFSANHLSASSAAMHPVPAAVTA